MTQPRIIVALDYASAQEALALVERLDPRLCRLKVGKELFTSAGPALVEALVARGYDVFLDLKFHDIPNTVAQACRAAARMGVWMMNLHASGGRTMMTAAREALAETPLGAGGATRRPLLVAVTVLTSMTDADVTEAGYVGSVAQGVARLARLTADCGLDGVVCSAQEAEGLRAAHGPGFLLVTPGIRLAGGDTQDQKRVMTPERAVAQGASYLVMGRPITQAADPVETLRAVTRGIQVSTS